MSTREDDDEAEIERLITALGQIRAAQVQAQVADSRALRQAILGLINGIIQDEGGIAGETVLWAVASVWCAVTRHGVTAEAEIINRHRDQWLASADVTLATMQAHLARLRT